MTRINVEQIAEQSEFVRLMNEVGLSCSSFEYRKNDITEDSEFVLEMYTKRPVNRLGRWTGTLNDARRFSAMFPRGKE